MISEKFPARERLKSIKTISHIFRKGNLLKSGSLHIKWEYSKHREPGGLKVMFSVPKRKIKKATDRNLMKRRLREAYRKHRHVLGENPRNLPIKMAFVFNGSQPVSYLEIAVEMKKGLEMLEKKIK